MLCGTPAARAALHCASSTAAPARPPRPEAQQAQLSVPLHISSFVDREAGEDSRWQHFVSMHHTHVHSSVHAVRPEYTCAAAGGGLASSGSGRLRSPNPRPTFLSRSFASTGLAMPCFSRPRPCPRTYLHVMIQGLQLRV